jgi:hypothetical protein
MNENISVKKTGQINVAAGEQSQITLNPAGIIEEIALESNLTTNRKNIKTNDITINGHKLNPRLYELTEFRNVLNGTADIGDLTVSGTVLVNTWEHHLKKYVLMLRPIRIPLFSKNLPPPEIPPGFSGTGKLPEITPQRQPEAVPASSAETAQSGENKEKIEEVIEKTETAEKTYD